MRERFAEIANKLAMDFSFGLDSADMSWQAPFPHFTRCTRCGSLNAELGFVAHEGLTPDDRGDIQRVHDLRDNNGAGDLWLHDCCAVAVYFCHDCLETSALYNQG